MLLGNHNLWPIDIHNSTAHISSIKPEEETSVLLQGLVPWVRCGTWLYRFLIFVLFITLTRLTCSITVSHFSNAPLFQGPLFLTKMMESNILYDNLFIDNFMNHSATKGNFDKFWKMHVLAERLYFLFRHYPGWSLWQKNTKNNLFIQVKLPFSVVEFSNTVTFWRNARFNVILTSVTIIKLGFLRKLFWNESLVGIEVSKH